MKAISPFITIVSLLTIFLPLSQCLISTPADQDDLVSKTCKQTPYYHLCISTLRSDPQSSKETTKDLTLIAIKAAKAKAIAILKEINELLESNPKLKDPLSKCNALYERVVSDHIPRAIEALDRDNYRSAENVVSKATEGVEESAKILFGISSFFRLARLLYDLFVVIRTIIKLLHGGSGGGKVPF
ncbi:hypothetical protein U1Q18_015865 [Sarracenia purpurea var. burkii]